ncbi:MAG: hypothetical protein JWO46_332 [Nocardioidaceae bacterium]|nr:hypothetical protein [Nocardioidaceae bacterium]
MDLRRAGAGICALAILVAAAACGGDPPTAATPAPSSPPASTSVATPTPTPVAPTPSISVPTELSQPKPDVQIEGADISWPQCPPGTGIPEKQGKGLPMPLDSAKFVVLGLTNGPGFTPNPCLADQVAFVKQRKLLAAAYSVVSYPSAAALRQYGGIGPYDAGTPVGRLSNAGYQQAVFNVATMRRVGLGSPVVWIDVEPVPLFDWPSDKAANAAVVQGAARGYQDAGLAIGAYSTTSLWERVVGDLRLGIPEWRAAGNTSREEALRRCGPERRFQGGLPVLTQWVDGSRDRNVTCPGTSVHMEVWFHQY